MKKSCSAKESKVVTTEDAENVLNVSKEDPKEQLTEEQLLINQKLLESGIEEEGLDWLEKRNIFKTINVSLDTAGTERLQRSSPRLAKATNSKPAKWIENSFENVKTEDLHNEKTPKTKSNKKDTESTPIRKSSPAISNKQANQETEESNPKSNHKVEENSCGDKLQGDGEIKSEDTPKSTRKVHYIKIQVEGREECNSQAEGGGGGQEISLGKKRASHPEIETIEAPKKIKMEEANNGISSEEETPLRIELEMEKMVPFKLRDINTIVSECETRNKKWKETFLKCKCPTRWGKPIVGTCSEKWDGKQIPPKLLHRYQKYLLSKNLTHPVFFPVKSPSGVDLNKLVCDISSQSSTGSNSECRDESEPDYKHLGEGSYIQGDSSGIGLENNLNASSSPSGRMVLRNRTQQKTVISDDEEVSSDDSDDWQAKQKSSKKQKTNAKNKRAAEQNNKQLVLKLERCSINKGNGNDGGRKNGNKNDIGFTGGSTMSTNSLNHGGMNTKSGPDPDTMVCPICSLRFKKQHIESHATECASKTYKD